MRKSNLVQREVQLTSIRRTGASQALQVKSHMRSHCFWKVRELIGFKYFSETTQVRPFEVHSVDMIKECVPVLIVRGT